MSSTCLPSRLLPGDFQPAAAQVDVFFIAHLAGGWLEHPFAQGIENKSAFAFRLHQASAAQDFEMMRNGHQLDRQRFGQFTHALGARPQGTDDAQSERLAQRPRRERTTRGRGRRGETDLQRAQTRSSSGKAEGSLNSPEFSQLHSRIFKPPSSIFCGRFQ